MKLDNWIIHRQKDIYEVIQIDKRMKKTVDRKAYKKVDRKIEIQANGKEMDRKRTLRSFDIHIVTLWVFRISCRQTDKQLDRQIDAAHLSSPDKHIIGIRIYRISCIADRQIYRQTNRQTGRQKLLTFLALTYMLQLSGSTEYLVLQIHSCDMIAKIGYTPMQKFCVVQFQQRSYSMFLSVFQ